MNRILLLGSSIVLMLVLAASCAGSSENLDTETQLPDSMKATIDKDSMSVHISGKLIRDISGVDRRYNSVEFNPIYTYPTTYGPTSMRTQTNTGVYIPGLRESLELLDDSGNVVESFMLNKRGDSFSILLIDPPDFDDIAIISGERALETNLYISPSRPVVSIKSPVSNQIFNGSDQIELTWEANDPDGDELSYKVQYSTDGGETYTTIISDYEDTKLSIDRSNVYGSNQTRYRVIASDGMRSTTAESDIFAVEECLFESLDGSIILKNNLEFLSEGNQPSEFYFGEGAKKRYKEVKALSFRIYRQKRDLSNHKLVLEFRDGTGNILRQERTYLNIFVPDWDDPKPKYTFSLIVACVPDYAYITAKWEDKKLEEAGSEQN